MTVIIDTDIGSDIDDAIAIAYAVKSGMDIKLITTVHGPTEIRAKITKKLTQQLGVEIPVAVGESKPLKQNHIFLTGAEGNGYINEKEKFDLKHDAVDALAEAVYDNKNEADIAAIGPLTNIAKAFQKYPDLSGFIRHIYFMGNAIVTSDNCYLNYRSHNLKVDPEAADIVFAAKIPLTIVTTEVCKKNYLTKEEVEELGLKAHGGNPALDYILTGAIEWMGIRTSDKAYLYDPLVVHHCLDESITEKVRFKNINITVDTRADFKEVVLDKLFDGRIV